MKIRLAADIQSDSIVDGKGIRAVIWTQGCAHHCPFCHNQETWDFNGGELVDIDDVIYELEKLEGQDGITISGGDPMYQPEACNVIAKKAHELGMNVWVYTGFTFDELIKSNNKSIKEFLENIDVLVDGRFEVDKKSMDLEFRGSSNQRIIDMKTSLKSNKVVLYNLNNDINEIVKKEAIYI